MALHDGKRVLKDGTGKLYKVPVADADQTAKAKGWVDATDQDVRTRADSLAEQAQFGGAAQTAQGVVEKVARTATFNLLPTSGDEMRRAKVLDETSPVLSFAAQAAGSALPALATGGLAAGAGLGKVGVAAAEGLASGAADEAEMAAVQDRQLSVGNIVMFGLGGELAGRAVPALLRRGIKGLAPPTDAAARVAGEAAEDLAEGEARKAGARAASEAAAMPEGPARATALAQTAPQQVERTSAELHSSLAAAEAVTAKLDKHVDSLADDLVSEAAPAQMSWATEQAKALRAQVALLGDGSQGIVSKSGRGSGAPSWKGSPKVAESVDARIAAYGDTPEFKDLFQQKAAETRRTPFGEGKERELWELQKDVLEENARQFPKVKDTGALERSRARQGQAGAVMMGRPKLDPSKVKALQLEGDGVAKTLSEDELDAIRSFTSRHGDKVGTPEWESAVTKLTVKNPTDAGPLYRGTRMQQAQLDELLRKGEWQNTEPTSLSYNRDLSDAFAEGRVERGEKVLFQFDQLDEGQNFLSREVGIGRSGLEREINLARPTKLRVLGSSIDDEGVTVVRLGSRSGEAGNVHVGQGVKDILSSPIGNVSGAAVGGAIGGSIDGRDGMAVGAGLGLAGSLLLGRKAGRSMGKLADDLLTLDGGPKMYKRARAGLRELEQNGAPPEVVKNLRDGLKRKELWGAAAELEEELGKVNAKATTARQAMPGADAAAFKEVLGKPPTQRGAAAQGIASAVESIEDMAAVAGKWGLLSKKQLARLTRAAKSARAALGDADAAVTGAAAKQTKRKASTGVAGEVVETIADMALGAMGMPPVAGIAVKMLWGRVDDSAKMAMKGAARRLVRPVYDESLDSAKSIVAVSALSRFQGDYSTPQQSFEAKSKLLDQVRLNPTAVPMALAQSTGNLWREDPKLFKQLAARVASQFAYVNANLPVSMGVSMVYPRGIAPSRSQLRDYAELWNSTFEPATVLEDLGNGEASPMQMRVLQDVHPDTYEQVKHDAIFEAANAFAEIPTQRKQQLDILFESDGVAGPCFSWRCAEYIQEGNDAAMQRGMSGPSFDPAGSEEMASPAASLNAIRSGVTNRGA